MRAPDDSLDDLCKATTKALARAFASGDVSPVEVTKASLLQAETINRDLNAFALIDHDGAFAAAEGTKVTTGSSAVFSSILTGSAVNVARCLS